MIFYVLGFGHDATLPIFMTRKTFPTQELAQAYADGVAKSYRAFWCKLFDTRKELEMITIEQKIRQENMFGCTEAAMKEMYESTITFRFDGPSKLAVSLMSDAQEEISLGLTEQARQTLNRAKWLLIEYVDWKAAK